MTVCGYLSGNAPLELHHQDDVTMNSSHDTPGTDRADTDRADTDRADTDRADTDRADTDGADPLGPEPDAVLDVRREAVGPVTVLHVSGEIDSDTASLFREHLADARQGDTAATPLIVDLSGVTYMASPGLSVLIEAHNEHQRLNTRLRVVAGSRATRVPIMTTGLHAQLDVVITLAQALPS